VWIVGLKNSWAFPVIESIHLAGVALLAGTAVLCDLRRLGVAVTQQPAEQLSAVFRPWAHSGLGLLLITGVLMTLADWQRYRANPAFSVKMALVVLALVSYFLKRKSRTAAIASLLLWTAVVLAARAIADFDI
jgi:hypothetical protein